MIDYFCRQLWKRVCDSNGDGNVDDPGILRFFEEHDLNKVPEVDRLL
jgi:hypothetical protein